MSGRRYAWWLSAICELSITRCTGALTNTFSVRAKEAVEKLTGEKVTAKRELFFYSTLGACSSASYSIAEEMC